LRFASYKPQSGLTNAYFEISFTGDVAQAWALGRQCGTSGPIQLFVSKADFELQDLTNDYSWDGTVLTLTEWPKVTLQARRRAGFERHRRRGARVILRTYGDEFVRVTAARLSSRSRTRCRCCRRPF